MTLRRVLVVALLATSLQLAAAKITKAEPFGFGPDGWINITVSDFALRQLYDTNKGKPVGRPSLDRLGFFITTAEMEPQLELDLVEGKCALDAEDVTITLFNFNELDSKSNSISTGYRLSDTIQDYAGGEFSLFFANCEPNSAVDYDVSIALYNVKGNKLDFLPVGDDMLPFVYFTMFVLFTSLAGLWGYMCYHAKQNAHKIHWIMLALVILKSLTVLMQGGMYHAIGLTGHPEGWNVAYYIFTFFRGILFFTVVVLISTGWSYMKPFLADREKNIIMVVVPLQVFANVAIVVLDEYTPAAESWFTWRDILHLVDIVCCCAILFPIVWSIKHLRDASETDGKAARVLSKLTLFRQFYIMVVSYIYFTRIIVYLLESTLPYRYIWFSNAASELATLAFYVACGIKFRPLAAGTNPYFALENDEIELAP
ncbi:hypothetical protein N2152v2_003722 [Parachlorella kessleri]